MIKETVPNHKAKKADPLQIQKRKIFPLVLLQVKELYLHLTLLDKTNKETVCYFEQKISGAREMWNLQLRQVIAKVDTFLMSNTERGERKLNKEDVFKLEQILKISENKLVTLWQFDKVFDAVSLVLLAEHGIKNVLTKIKN